LTAIQLKELVLRLVCVFAHIRLAASRRANSNHWLSFLLLFYVPRAEESILPFDKNRPKSSLTPYTRDLIGLRTIKKSSRHFESILLTIPPHPQ
jgi:hypothetical protein